MPFQIYITRDSGLVILRTSWLAGSEYIWSEHARLTNTARPHQGINQEQPVHRSPELTGDVVALPILNGLHHDDRRAA
jgi:hypothetical protein